MNLIEQSLKPTHKLMLTPNSGGRSYKLMWNNKTDRFHITLLADGSVNSAHETVAAGTGKNRLDMISQIEALIGPLSNFKQGWL